jgi:AcrR family transcriptional regulator
MAHRPGKAAILRAAVEVMGRDGYEGSSTRDMAARAGVTVAALYHHFPSKLDLLREFLDEAHEITLARIERRLAALPAGTADDAGARLDEAVGTLIATHLHDDFARRASNVALREYTRLAPADRAVIDAKRARLLDLFTALVAATGVAEPRETARAIVTLCSSLVEPFTTGEIGPTMAAVITQQQTLARRLAGIPSEGDP